MVGRDVSFAGAYSSCSLGVGGFSGQKFTMVDSNIACVLAG